MGEAGDLARRGMLALAFGACATTPPVPMRWQPDLTAELRESCKQTPVVCRQAAEELATGWTTDDEAFGALKAFSAACEAGDSASCTAVDTRFTRPLSLADPPAPAYPRAAREKRVQGTWVARCALQRTGEVTACTIEQGLPELDGPFLAWIRPGPWRAPTLDGRPFGCEDRFEFRLSVR